MEYAVTEHGRVIARFVNGGDADTFAEALQERAASARPRRFREWKIVYLPTNEVMTVLAVTAK